MDVWSEYAACRSTALFRPEAAEDFEGMFCQSLQDTKSRCKHRIVAYRENHNALEAFFDLQQLFGDLFIHAGYLLGHLDGLEQKIETHAPRASQLLSAHSNEENLFRELRQQLHKLWLTEYSWEPIDVLAPIYELICAMMALHGLVFARHGDEWRIVMTEE
jgi:hypothetical protein